METKANYVTVGIFTLITIALGFAFVVWVGRLDERGAYVDLDIMIEGSVTGLVKGSQVLFNGIQVGTVSKLEIASNAPRFVIARVRINAKTPIRKDTKASIGIQGFTGGAYVQLEGGSPDAQNVLGIANVQNGQIPRINAEPAALSDIIAKVNSIAARTEKVMGGVEQFLNDNRTSLNRTIANAEKFSDALAENADGVESFLAGVANVAKTINALSSKLDGMIKGAEDIVKAVDPEAVRKTITNLEGFSKTLNASREDVAKVVEKITNAAEQLSKFSDGLNTTLGKVDGLIASVDAAKIGTAVDDLSVAATRAKKIIADVENSNIKATLDDISKTAADAKGLVASVDAAKIGTAVDDLSAAAASAKKIIADVENSNIKATLDDISKIAADAKGLVASVDATKIGTAVDDLSAAATSAKKIIADVENSNITATLNDISKIAADAKGLVAAIEPEELSAIVDNIGKTVDQATALVAAIDVTKINSAVVNLDQAAQRVNGVLGALKPEQVRRIADNLEKTINDASTFVAKIEVGKINSAFDEFAQASKETKKLVSAVDSTRIAALIDDLGKTIKDTSLVVAAIDANRIASVVASLEKTAKGASIIVEDVANVTSKFRDRGDDINQIISDAKELAGRLNKSSTRVDGILAKLDGMLGGGNGEGLVSDARATMAEFRKMAKNLDARVSEISRGLSRFSNRGLAEAEILIRQARQSINRIDRVISDFEKNPSAFIVGSPGIRQVSGRRPRR